MTTSKSSTNKSKTSGGFTDNGVRTGPPQFVQYRLSATDLEAARNAASDSTDVGEIVAQFIAEGYKFSASFDKYGGGTQCFITPQAPENRNAGWTLSARAPSLIEAVGVLCWKHYTLFMQEWPKDDSGPRGNNWG